MVVYTTDHSLPDEGPNICRCSTEKRVEKEKNIPVIRVVFPWWVYWSRFGLLKGFKGRRIWYRNVHSQNRILTYIRPLSLAFVRQVPSAQHRIQIRKREKQSYVPLTPKLEYRFFFFFFRDSKSPIFCNGLQSWHDLGGVPNIRSSGSSHSLEFNLRI